VERLLLLLFIFDSRLKAHDRKMSVNDWWNRYMSLVCGRNWSRRRMTEYQEAGCFRGWMQQLGMNTSQQ